MPTLMLALLVPLTASMQDETALQMQIQDVLQANLEATEAEDLDAILETMHPQSPGRQGTMTIAQQLFPQFDLEYSLSNVRYLFQDGEYVIGRGIQSTRRKAGPDFPESEVDSMYVFKRDEQGELKLWSQAILTIKPL